MNIKEAETREKEAIEKLNIAKQHLLNSQNKASYIRNQSDTTAQLEQQNYKKQTIDDIDRLHKLKQEAILLQQKKVMKQLSQQMIKKTLNRVYLKLENRYDSLFQNSVNNFYIALFRKYQPKS